MILNLILSLQDKLPCHLEDQVELDLEITLLHLLHDLEVPFVALHLNQ